MKKKRIITVKEGDRKIYHGVDRRFYDEDYKSNNAFGVPMFDWIKIGIYITGVIIFFVKADVRISQLEENNQKLTNLSIGFQQYIEASDGFHSAIFQTQFKNGRPIDGGFKANNKRY